MERAKTALYEQSMAVFSWCLIQYVHLKKTCTQFKTWLHAVLITLVYRMRLAWIPWSYSNIQLRRLFQTVQNTIPPKDLDTWWQDGRIMLKDPDMGWSWACPMGSLPLLVQSHSYAVTYEALGRQWIAYFRHGQSLPSFPFQKPKAMQILAANRQITKDQFDKGTRVGFRVQVLQASFNTEAGKDVLNDLKEPRVPESPSLKHGLSEDKQSWVHRDDLSGWVFRLEKIRDVSPLISALYRTAGDDEVDAAALQELFPPLMADPAMPLGRGIGLQRFMDPIGKWLCMQGNLHKVPAGRVLFAAVPWGVASAGSKFDGHVFV